MFILSQLLWGFVCIHAFWLYCFITGTLVRVERPPTQADQKPLEARHYMAELVISSSTGIAITGFALLLLGFLGLLNVVGLLLWLILEILLFRIIKQENVFAVKFWVRRLAAVRRAWRLPALIIYLVFLILLVPAILPPTSFDSTMYHLAYAVDWANAGRIYPDLLLRYPYYANNFLLIYSLMFVLKLGQLCHFATWLCGLLSSLGVYVLIAEDATKEAKAGRWLRFIIALKNTVLPLALALSPVFLKHLTVGYVDIPIGLFVLIPVLCTYLVLNGNPQNYEINLVLTAAFCAGMKITLFLCLPLFVLSLFLVLRRRQKSLSRMLALFTLLMLLSAPWYLRNLIAVGDPIPPVLNLMVKGSDRIFTPGDYENQKRDLPTLRDSSPVWLLPINLFRATNSNAFREPGVNVSVVLLYLPLASLFLMFFKSFRRGVGPVFFYLNFAVVYLMVNWLSISVAARYALHLLPVFLGYLGLCFNFAFQYVQSVAVKNRRMALALQGSLLLTLLALLYPSPSSGTYYRETYQLAYAGLPVRLETKEAFLNQNLRGYRSTQTLINSMYANGNQHQRVLAVGGENLSFYFRERKIVNVGDWFGPGRYRHLLDAVDNSQVPDYLSRFDIGAVLIDRPRNQMTEPQYQRFINQLELSHFKLLPKVEPNIAIYLKTSDQ